MRRIVAPVALVALAALGITAAALALDRRDTGSPSSVSGDRSAPVLSPVRVAGPIVEAAARRALEEELKSIAVRSPTASCLVVHRADEPLYSHQADRPLVPASGTKLLTAVAAVHAGAGDPDDIVRMLKDSDNDAARRLFAALGANAVRGILGEAGVPLEGVAVVDGSGLDRANRATCAALHATVVDGYARPQVVAGLAVAGRDGTLRDRFVGTGLEGRLRAKTGSIRGVATLVGMIDVPGGRPVTFAHVVNDIQSAEVGVALQDEVVEALARFVAGAGS